MHPTPRTLWALVVALALLPPGARAFSTPRDERLRAAFGKVRGSSISPRPIGTVWDLARSSDAIVIARAEGRSVVEENLELVSRIFGRDGRGLGFVELHHMRVIETLHGTSRRKLVIPADTARVQRGELVQAHQAPEPFRTLTGQSAEILFLPKPQGREPYWDLSRQERISPRDGAELEAFRTWIAEAVALQRSHSGDVVPEQEVVSWAARGIARRATRLHALQALGTRPLTRAQVREIMAGFVQEPTTDESFPALLSLVESEPSPEFDRIAVGVMISVLGDERTQMPLWSVNALPRLMKRLGFPEVERAQVTGRADGSIFPTKAFMRAAWEAFRKHRLAPPAQGVPAATSLGSSSSSRPGYFIES